jgi:hypothetical protein
MQRWSISLTKRLEPNTGCYELRAWRGILYPNEEKEIPVSISWEISACSDMAMFLFGWILGLIRRQLLGQVFLHGRGVTQAVSPTSAARVRAQVRSCGIYGQSSTEASFLQVHRFPCQSFQRLLHNHHPPSGAGTGGQTVADVLSGLSLTPH